MATEFILKSSMTLKDWKKFILLYSKQKDSLQDTDGIDLDLLSVL